MLVATEMNSRAEIDASSPRSRPSEPGKGTAMSESLIYEPPPQGARTPTPKLDVPEAELHVVRAPDLPLPEVSEIEIVRFLRLSQLNYAVDKGTHPWALYDEVQPQDQRSHGAASGIHWRPSPSA